MDERTSPEEFGLLFKRFLDDIVNRAEVPEGPLLKRLRAHLGGEPTRMPVISEEIQRFEQPNLQVAMDAYLEEAGHSAELIGLAPEKAVAQAFLKDVTALMRERNVYRGKIVSLEPQQFGFGPQTIITFHRLPKVTRDDVILPSGVLDRIDRHAIAFSEHAGQLIASGRPVKRGLLLYGSPGTGK